MGPYNSHLQVTSTGGDAPTRGKTKVEWAGDVRIYKFGVQTKPWRTNVFSADNKEDTRIGPMAVEQVRRSYD
jgi:hypothetical protein